MIDQKRETVRMRAEVNKFSVLLKHRVYFLRGVYTFLAKAFIDLSSLFSKIFKQHLYSLLYIGFTPLNTQT